MSFRPESFVQNYKKFETSARVNLFDHVKYKRAEYPLATVSFGNSAGPTLLLAGGVHGLERIGAQLALSFLESFHQRLMWDRVLHEMLEKIQVVFMPLVNPVGYFETRRGNGNGVDLMRNAPVEAEERVPLLLGGHRLSNRIHWYRGDDVQPESKFVFSTVQDILKKNNTVISLDIHSGFGFRDRLWFPFANSRRHFSQIDELYLLFSLFEKSHPHHLYVIEPQSKNYLTHGDLWDYCFLNFKKPGQVYLPLTLEMGSWIWVKKNPLQLFSKTGLFNPIKEHRMNRTLRRHRPLFDFLLHALYSESEWAGNKADTRLITHKAIEKYYAKK